MHSTFDKDNEPKVFLTKLKKQYCEFAHELLFSKEFVIAKGKSYFLIVKFKLCRYEKKHFYFNRFIIYSM